jgi:sugar phosphate isomerase/epimerase
MGFTVSGFADEVDDDLAAQLDVFEELDIRHVDLRSAWGTNVLEFDVDQVDRVRAALEERGMEVACIGSPIGKVAIGEPFEPHLDRFRTALDRAGQFDADYVRIFSYWLPEDDDPDAHREEVLRRMRRKADLAAERDVVLVHENEKEIYGETPARCRDILEHVDSPHLRAVFDPANFLEAGIDPYPDALLQLVEHVEYLHVKDCVRGERGEIRPAGEGDARFADLLDALRRRGFDGFAALEPHLASAGEKGGYSGPEAFAVAARALRELLAELDDR